MLRYILLLALSLLLPAVATAQTQPPLIFKDYQPGTYVMEIGEDGTIVFTRGRIVTPGGSPPPVDPPPDPPPGGFGLVEKAEAALAEVPQHPQRETARTALAAIYRTIGDQYASGKIPRDELASTLDQAVDAVLGVMQVKEHWSGFQETMKDELNALQLRQPAQVKLALHEISEGILPDNAAIEDIIPHVIDLITAIRNKDFVGVIQAALKLITELIGQDAASSNLLFDVGDAGEVHNPRIRSMIGDVRAMQQQVSAMVHAAPQMPGE